MKATVIYGCMPALLKPCQDVKGAFAVILHWGGLEICVEGLRDVKLEERDVDDGSSKQDGAAGSSKREVADGPSEFIADDGLSMRDGAGQPTSLTVINGLVNPYTVRCVRSIGVYADESYNGHVDLENMTIPRIVAGNATTLRLSFT